MNHCPFCHHDNPPENRFCGRCGAQLREPAEIRGTMRNLQRQVFDLLDDGRKIEAIKLYRELTGAGLKDAKDAVEAIL